MLHIATVTSPNYLIPTAAMAKTALRATGEDIHFHVFSFPMFSFMKKNLEAQIRSCGGEISFYEVDGKSSTFFGHLTTDLFLKLRIPEMLNGLSRVLFLDSDLIVRKDLTDLFNTKLEGNFIGASRDPVVAGWRIAQSEQGATYAKLANPKFRNFEDYTLRVLGMKKNDNYFNSGVMLMDLEKLRDLRLNREAYQTAKKGRILFGDQCVLNASLRRKVLVLSDSYNFCPWPEKNWVLWPEGVRESYHLASQDPKIVHFAGPSKPWSRDSTNPYSYLFWEGAEI